MEPEALEKGIGAIPDPTGRGIDQTSPQMLKAQPPEGKWQMLMLLRNCERRGAWPWQWLMCITVLLGKPEGGERPIAP